MQERLHRLFLVCMLICAGLVMFFIWNEGPPSSLWFQTAATLFIVGLASFLVWFTQTLIAIKKRIAE